MKVKQTGTYSTAGENGSGYNPLGNVCLAESTKAKHMYAYDPAAPLLRTSPTKMGGFGHLLTYKNVARSFIIVAQYWKQPKYSSTLE